LNIYKTSFLALTLGFSAIGYASEETSSDWHFGGSVIYSSRSLEGALVNQNTLYNNGFGTMIATGDSTGVGKSNGLMYQAAMQYKKWGLAINYMPTSFTGDGKALVAVGAPGTGIYQQSPLSTDVDVTMTLGNLYYNFIQNKEHIVGIGVGIGKTEIDVAIVPELGSSLTMQDTQPFGFFNFHFSNNYQGFLYGFSINWMHGNFSGTTIDYSDYNIQLGYRLNDKMVKTDIIVGYRDVNFAMDYRDSSEVLLTDLTLAGPQLGLRVLY
jgi:hypothetical protein